MPQADTPELMFTSHRIETNTDAPVTVLEVTAGGQTRWLVDHRAHALRSERSAGAWDAQKADWADISALEERKALYQTIVRVPAEIGQMTFGKEKTAWQGNFDFESVVTNARAGIMKLAHIAESATDTSDRKVSFSNPVELSEFLRATYQAPRSALDALAGGTLRGKQTYRFAPADLEDIAPRWTVKTEHSMAPHLSPIHNIQQVFRDLNDPGKRVPSAVPTLTRPDNMRLALEMLETGGDMPGRNTTLSLGSQLVAANFIADSGALNAQGLPEPFERRTKKDPRLEDFRQADGRRCIAALAEDKTMSSLGRFAEARETAASLIDPRSPQGREWTAWTASSRWAVNSKDKSKVVTTERDRMLQMAADYPDPVLGQAISRVALNIETVEPYQPKDRTKVESTARD